MHIEHLIIPDVKDANPRRNIVIIAGFSPRCMAGRHLLRQGLTLSSCRITIRCPPRKERCAVCTFRPHPLAQDKLVRVVRGSVFDVAVDLRQSSPTYGKHVSIILSSEAWNQILVPIGFAHGFMTLEPDTEVIYKVSDCYAPDYDKGLLWNDPTLGIIWPIAESTAIVSEKDRRQPQFAEFATPFE